jgi:hypothetical protein
MHWLSLVKKGRACGQEHLKVLGSNSKPSGQLMQAYAVESHQEPA